MVDYYAYTEDSTFLSTTTEALLSQVGPDNNYIVPAHRFDEVCSILFHSKLSNS